MEWKTGLRDTDCIGLTSGYCAHCFIFCLASFIVVAFIFRTLQSRAEQNETFVRNMSMHERKTSTEIDDRVEKVRTTLRILEKCGRRSDTV